MSKILLIINCCFCNNDLKNFVSFCYNRDIVVHDTRELEILQDFVKSQYDILFVKACKHYTLKEFAEAQIGIYADFLDYIALLLTKYKNKYKQKFQSIPSKQICFFKDCIKERFVTLNNLRSKDVMPIIIEEYMDELAQSKNEFRLSKRKVEKYFYEFTDDIAPLSLEMHKKFIPEM